MHCDSCHHCVPGIGLYGVLKGFVGFLLSDFTGECPLHIIPRKNRAIMRERGKKLRLTAEFGRPYRCIVDSYKSFQLVDWLHFLETSLFVLRTDVLDEVMQKMWDRLRYGALTHVLNNLVLVSVLIICWQAALLCLY